MQRDGEMERRELLAAVPVATLGVTGGTRTVGRDGGTRPPVRDVASAAVETTVGETPPYREVATFAADDGDGRDGFADTIAVDGDTALVGASGDDNSNARSAGSAYAFERDGGAWAQQAKLVTDDGGIRDKFGSSVDLDDDLALVGAPDEELGLEQTKGAAYVFERSEGEWTQQAKLTPGESGPGVFGRAVALCGDTALVGDFADHNMDGKMAGEVYVFDRVDGEWIEGANFTSSDGDETDFFGQAVALGDDVALVTAPGDDDPNGERAGAAYVYERVGGEWTRQSKLAADDGNSGDNFGRAAALDGTTALIGAPLNGNSHNPETGAAYIFERSGGTWTQQAKLTADERIQGRPFGSAVALDDSVALVGAPVEDDVGGFGVAFRFERTDGAWSLADSLHPRDRSETKLFGSSVALEHETVFVGDRFGDGREDDTGVAYVFERRRSPPDDGGLVDAVSDRPRLLAGAGGLVATALGLGAVRRRRADE